jgi:hypothetical protein
MPPPLSEQAVFQSREKANKTGGTGQREGAFVEPDATEDEISGAWAGTDN